MTEVATSLDITGGILVGHDGSTAADHAVRWAARWADRIGSDVHVVRTWVLSSAPRPPSWSPGYVPPMADYEQAVLSDLQSDVDALELPGSTAVRCHALHGSPGRRLVEASEKVDLVVVASRGAGGFRGLVLGSTADQLVRHAACPVVVIPVHAIASDAVAAEPADPDTGLRGE